jgi:hypothetical protein
VTQPALQKREPAGGPIAVERLAAMLSGGPVLTLLLAVLFVNTWAPLLIRSFWVDEAGVYWMAHEGVVRSVQKTLIFPGQSILYSMIAALFCFDGTPLRDFLLRVPSLIGIGLAAYFIYRLGEGWIGRGTGLAAVILFVFHPDLVMIGYQARPYALAIAAVTGSCWAVCEWDRTRERRPLLWYLLASTLVFYLHYFFAFILAIQALYVMYVAFVSGRRERLWELVGTVCAIPVLSLPLVPHLRALVRERDTMPYLAAPSFQDLTDYLAPSTLIAGLLIAALICAQLLRATDRRKDESRPAFLLLIGAWWLVGPLLFFVVSRATPMTVFVPRYLAFTHPAQALVLAYLGYRVFGGGYSRVWAFLGVLLFAANPLIMTRWQKGNDELLPVIRMVRAEPNAPVFFPSLLQQSLFYDWRSGNQPDSYLFAPLVAYPITNPLLPIPARATDDAKSYVDDTISGRLAQAPEVVFVDKDDRWDYWIRERMARAGFHPTVQPAGHFKVFVFRK